jgi:hypothetical protein
MPTVSNSKILRFAGSSLLIIAMALLATQAGSARDKYETIEAQAFGTGTQMGQNIGVTLNNYEFSTPADRVGLVQAFEKGQNQGLVNALSKMKAVGHVEVTGTLGYDCSYIRMTPTPTGRKIVFVTNRQIRFGEALADSQSQSFNLTAGVFEIDSTDKSKSTGMLYPAAQLPVGLESESLAALRCPLLAWSRRCQLIGALGKCLETLDPRKEVRDAPERYGVTFMTFRIRFDWVGTLVARTSMQDTLFWLPQADSSPELATT